MSQPRLAEFGLHSVQWISRFFIALTLVLSPVELAAGAVLDKQAMLDSQTFWDNRDWDWYKANIPFFDCPDPEITTTYYYRWELVTKHLTYGSPESGYSFTEFIDRPFWSGAYGSISCPAGHQLYEVRWLRNPDYAEDYARYWFRTPGAQPRRYSTWLADAVWAVRLAHGNPASARELLPDLLKNMAGWEKDYFVPEVGLFWQIGHDDGMEYNINSRQTMDLVRGGPGFRPSFNAYMWAEMMAIANIAESAGERDTARQFRSKADGVKSKLQSFLWEPEREFFINRFKNDEIDQQGNVIKAGTFTYESGKFAGDPHGREEIGFVPWQFNLPDAGYEAAWRFLMDSNYFAAPFGPRTVERNDPLYVIQPTCCWWSGMSWPYATSQTLKGMANLLQNYQQTVISRADYYKQLRTYALTHRKNGRPYLAEAAHPETGSWSGHDSYNHSEHYFHSSFNDLIITGLIGLKPRADGVLELDPLAPVDWTYFALEDLPYQGHLLTIGWDRDGKHYGKGAGLRVLADGKEIAAAPTLSKLTAKLPAVQTGPAKKRHVNYAVNNAGTYYPHLTASFTHPKFPLAKLNDGNYWYHVSPPNRWTTEGSNNRTEFIEVDFGTKRTVDTVKLYLLDDAEQLTTPERVDVQYWDGSGWNMLPKEQRKPAALMGHRANTFSFREIATSKLKISLLPKPGKAMGLTEIEAWGDATLSISAAPPPTTNAPSGSFYPQLLK